MSKASHPENRRIAMAAVFSLPLIWGTTFAIVQRAIQDVTPMAFVAIRFGLAALLFLIFSKAARRGLKIFIRPKGGLEKRFRRDMIVLGAALGAGYIFQTVGLLTTTSSKSAFLTSTPVIWTPLLSSLLGRERLTIRLIAAVTVTLIGIFLMTHPFGAGGIVIGDILTIGCAMAFAVYIAWIDMAMPRARKIAADDHEAAMLVTSTQIVAASILFIVLLPFVETPHILLSTTAVSAILYTAIAATVLTAYLQTRYQHFVSPTTASIIYMLEPVVAMLVAAIFLKEQMGFVELLGGGLIILGVIIAQMNFHPKVGEI